LGDGEVIDRLPWEEVWEGEEFCLTRPDQVVPNTANGLVEVEEGGFFHSVVD
jgi:hypothetical protein